MERLANSQVCPSLPIARPTPILQVFERLKTKRLNHESITSTFWDRGHCPKTEQRAIRQPPHHNCAASDVDTSFSSTGTSELRLILATFKGCLVGAAGDGVTERPVCVSSSIELVGTVTYTMGASWIRLHLWLEVYPAADSIETPLLRCQIIPKSSFSSD
ncbi:hypothetical protein D9613_000067 [Agrocybe pediades]|uniref:Uncharacterized protein n=1 Tax=Agrocybe pediades TaxID=84607 RepID=A0A8H4VUX4_9AGAR|nr:hypothetical protein D9613_000067 [Agrocybe pediades]